MIDLTRLTIKTGYGSDKYQPPIFIVHVVNVIDSWEVGESNYGLFYCIFKRDEIFRLLSRTNFDQFIQKHEKQTREQYQCIDAQLNVCG